MARSKKCYTRFGFARSDPEAELAEPLPAEPLFEETIDEVRVRVAPQVGRVRNERDLSASHPLIRNLLADVYESLVGAIYLDGGLEAAREFILRYVGPEIEQVAETQPEMIAKLWPDPFRGPQAYEIRQLAFTALRAVPALSERAAKFLKAFQFVGSLADGYHATSSISRTYRSARSGSLAFYRGTV